MAKIVFVDPPITLKERYGKFSGGGSTIPSYGLLLLAAVARQNGHGVGIVEAASLGLNFRQTLKEIFFFKPDYVGLTATTVSIFHAAKLAKMIKEKDQKIITIIGGPHVTAAPKETMSRFSSFDVAVLGEGEETIVELLKALDKGRELRKITGLLIRKGKKLVNTGLRAPVKNLDKLPTPAWDLLPGFPEKYRPAPFRFRQLPAAMLLASRGCPNQCIFCDRSVFGNFCRSHSPEYIFSLMKKLHDEYGICEILFEDDTFFIFRKNIKKLCQLLIRADLGISWSCAGRVNMVDRELLKMMKKAGCWHISYGIETGDEEILKFIKKGITLEQVRKAVGLTQKAGIFAKGFFIIGHPKETKKTIEKTINLARSLPLSDASFFKMTPLPGCQLYQKAGRYGKFDDDWRKMNLMTAVFVPWGLNKKELDDYQKQAFREFYLRPRIIFSYLKRIFDNPAIGWQLIKGSLGFSRGII